MSRACLYILWISKTNNTVKHNILCFTVSAHIKSLILLRLLVLPVSGEELSCALGLRVFNHIARRALLDDHAAVHEDHAACDIAGKRHFVCDDDHRHVLLGKRTDDLQNLPGQLGVERRGRLIKAENIRLQGQRPRDGHTLLLTAGKLMRIEIHLFLQPDLRQKFLTYTCGLNSEEYGVGFRKGSDLVQKLNDFFKASYADGSILKIAETYGVQAAVIEQK